MYSVVIPLYNKEKYIEKCINSLVVSADTADILVEFIIVNDCSTDTSLFVASSIKDQRVRIIDLVENQGPSNARNIGVANATFENIYFIDADDLVDKQFFSILNDKKFLEKEFVCVDICRFNSHNSIPTLEYQHKEVDVIDLPTLSYHKFLSEGKELFTASSVIIRKDVFIELGGFSLESNFTEDAEFWARLSFKCCGIYVPLILSYYRMVQNSLSHDFFYNFNEVPILLKTLLIQRGNSNSPLIYGAANSMMLKYLFISRASNRTIFNKLRNITREIDLSIKVKLVSSVLLLFPSDVIKIIFKLLRRG
ncbi:glycosyltransferase family 2 protein [Vibrio sp. VB16]|uniref:glycosyltransferase family 2 protein n=1 Tax=Vibrio sp. VB16 TaxID=2785746 RepID=UPI00189CBCD6|nr:glycosyltransferase family 2 protein [Vibrio sp. VB16]UGA57354.1 glycosyltransferase [Vibrio sp. VB16]